MIVIVRKESGVKSVPTTRILLKNGLNSLQPFTFGCRFTLASILSPLWTYQMLGQNGVQPQIRPFQLILCWQGGTQPLRQFTLGSVDRLLLFPYRQSRVRNLLPFSRQRCGVSHPTSK